MPELIKTKVRAIGTSFGVIIPSESLKEQNVKDGEEIEIVIYKENKNMLKLINESFGMVKNEKFPFKRDKSDRMKKYDINR